MSFFICNLNVRPVYINCNYYNFLNTWFGRWVIGVIKYVIFTHYVHTIMPLLRKTFKLFRLKLNSWTVSMNRLDINELENHNWTNTKVLVISKLNILNASIQLKKLKSNNEILNKINNNRTGMGKSIEQ